HDGRLAGNVTSVMARERARIDVVAAAGRRSDQEIDALAGVVIAGRGGGCERGERDQSGKDACLKAHRRVSAPWQRTWRRLGHPCAGDNSGGGWVAAGSSAASRCTLFRSSPRKRGPRVPDRGPWIPAFAGMNGVFAARRATRSVRELERDHAGDDEA